MQRTLKSRAGNLHACSKLIGVAGLPVQDMFMGEGVHGNEARLSAHGSTAIRNESRLFAHG